MPALQPVDEGFFDSAPTRYSQTWQIDRPASEVWDELAGDRPLHWCRGLAVKWTSRPPFSTESTRQATLMGVLKLEERFFVWEEGRRYTFYIAEANLPLFKSLAEDYIVEPVGPSRCTFTWNIAAEPSALGKPGGPMNGLLLRSFFRDTTRYFATS